ncbi:TraC family protein [Endothiovibrio diazotrophicus]
MSLLARLAGLQRPAADPGEPPAPGAEPWDGAGRPPLARADHREPLVHTEQQAAARHRPRLDDALPWRDALGEWILLNDLRSTGVLWRITPVGCEARPPAFLAALRERIRDALALAPPEEAAPWVVQLFVQDVPSLESLAGEMVAYAQPWARESDYTRAWCRVMADHMREIGRPAGLFDDEAVCGGRWRGRRREVHMTLYRKVPEGAAPDLGTEEVAQRLENALRAVGVGLERLDGAGLHDWLTPWFCPAPPAYGGDSAALLMAEPYTEGTLGALAGGTSLAERVFHGHRPWLDAEGAWWFTGLPHRFLPLEALTRVPTTGHLTAERPIGDHHLALWDRMPEGAILSLSIVYHPQEQQRADLERLIARNSGEKAEFKALRRKAEAALERIAEHDPILPVMAGVYLRAERVEALEQRANEVAALFGAQGMNLIRPGDDPIAADSYLRALPMAFDPALDALPFRRRARRMFASDLAALVPLYGRSVGTGHPGAIAYTRLGEPILFDPLHRADRRKNAHMVVVGPSGAGKTAKLIDLLSNVLALHRPRLFVMGANRTFELAAAYWASLGLTVRYLRFHPEEDVAIPPFADALRLLEPPAEGDEIGGDRLGPMEAIAKVMITGGEPAELARYGLDDWEMVRQALHDAAERVRDHGSLIPEAGHAQVMVSDVVAALDALATTGHFSPERRDRIVGMGYALNRFTRGVAGRFFDRPGRAWPDVDVTVVDYGLLTQDAHRDLFNAVFLSLMTRVNELSERYQADERHLLVVPDEAHLLLRNPLIGPILVQITALWRARGAWLWLALQTLRQFPEETRGILNNAEWWLCLAMDPDEVSRVKRFKELTEEQEALLRAARKEPGKYTEGVVLSDALLALFRNVPPAITLALGQTEKDERAARRRLMSEAGIDELEAVRRIARELAEARRQDGTDR